MALAVAMLSLGGSAIAANRCVDAKGRVTYQDAACSKDAESTKKVDISEGFSTRPAPVASPRVATYAAQLARNFCVGTWPSMRLAN